MPEGRLERIMYFLHNVFVENKPIDLEGLFHPDCIVHIFKKDLAGREHIAHFIQNLKDRFNEITIKKLEVFFDGDNILTHWRCQGLSTGKYPEQPKGKMVYVCGMSRFLFRGSKIQEHWGIVMFKDTPHNKML